MSNDRETRLWAMFLHLSLFAGYLVPFLGLLAPILIWQIKKEDLPEIDKHGKMVVNWIISVIIYGIIFSILSIVLIGIPLLVILFVLSIIFPIIGGINANNGKLWKYPLTFKIIK